MEGALFPLSQAIAAAILAIIAWQDWTQRRIPNWAVGVLLASALVRWLVGDPSSNELMFNLLIVAAISIPGMASATLGAGDVKLLFALAPLWTTDTLVHAFSFGILALFGLAAASDAARHHSTPGGAAASTLGQLRQRGIPLGTAIALGALITATISLFKGLV